MLTQLTTRARILLLVLASALPSTLLSLYVAFEHRQVSLQRASEELSRRAELIEALLPAFQLDALPQRGAETLGRGQMVTVIDHAGHVIVQHPPLFAKPGDRFPNDKVLAGLTRGETFFELPDPEAVPRLYATRTTTHAGGSVLTVIVSMPKAMAYDSVDRALTQTLLGIAAATVALLAIAWMGAGRMVLTPIRRMLAVTSRVRRGDLTARTGMPGGREELSQLGASLDAMAQQLAERDSALRQALEEQIRRALTDSLTGLYNRRFFSDALQRQLAASGRSGEPFCVILFDLDHFKAVNDTYGHDAGDSVLEQTAAVLLRSIRASDLAVRHGGEEFAVLLPDTDVHTAAERAEQIRRALETHAIVRGSNRIHITASFGVVQSSAREDAGSLLQAVDAAMYAAKAAGRNRVVVSQRQGEGFTHVSLEALTASQAEVTANSHSGVPRSPG
jgi:diguanylate cyclase (GGDEF)-like protein